MPGLASATGAFAEVLRSRLPAAAFRAFEPRYAEEPRGRFRTPEALVVAPASVEEVAEVIRAAARAGVGVVPIGGGTGLVAGQIAPDGPAPLLLSLERMRAIRETRPEEDTLTAEAGATLAEVQAAARAAGRLFPLSIASEGTAQMGGVLAANAGGVNTLRWGNARALCLGVEAVLPDGSVHHGLTRLRKDNMGYDLRDLLIGAEGTLGVITAASLRLVPLPAVEATILLAVPGPEAALRLLTLCRQRLGEVVSAFELMHRQGFDFLAETMGHLRPPFAEPPEWCVLLDIGAPETLALDAALDRLLAEATEAGLVSDGWLAQSEAQRATFWLLRESIPEANRRIGAVASHDIAVPLSAIPDFIARAGSTIARIGPYRVNCFGHVGDGNLHYNVFPPPGSRREDHTVEGARISETIYDLVHGFGGSVAAEHGIGRLKVAALERYADPAKLAAMRAIKAALDPAGIMNPGAVLRAAG